MNATDMGATDVGVTPTSEASATPAAQQPQLRTLLLTDLCDSLTLVERLGDSAAADLFRAHDRLVLQLQQQWRGRLIDRSDGLLLLFERPIDGLGFALDYVRGLHELGDVRQLTLKARAGLHVGEVLTWRNSDEAVRVGAKPLEVEGLAKPTAARLMATARAGQILLSAVAEPLAHRSARELGERGQNLLWKSYGRWRFKGVPDAQEIFEVGEPGLAPLRAPPNTPKAWRDTPLWRRPMALLAEAAALAVIGVGIWFMTRPQPAIAFAERDWVVVADLRNLTGQPVLDESLEQAFRISLEQSRYVNVLSDLKARDTLARMQRPAGTPLDRGIASEIAVREGARAVILPTVVEVGGRLRVSAEVIDPHSQTTVYTERADGKGAASALDSIDDVTAALRGRLGEALATIERDSAPLPEVSTANLDALRAYALAQKAYSVGHEDEAMRLFLRATDLDPGFALAWIGQLRAAYSDAQAPRAEAALRRAQALRGRLAPREALYVDAWVSEHDEPTTTRDRWISLARLYPDYVAGPANAVNWLIIENRYAEALPFAQRQLRLKNALVPLAHDQLGRVRLGLEQYAPAAQAFEAASKAGNNVSKRRRAEVAAAQRQLAVAERWLAMDRENNRFFDIERIALAVDRADWSTAARVAARAVADRRYVEAFDHRAFKVSGATVGWLRGEPAPALASVRAVAADALTRMQARDADAVDNALLAASSALLALRLGDAGLAEDTVRRIEAETRLNTHPVIVEFIVLLRAERARSAGQPQAALALLKPLLTGHERYETHVALMDAATDAGDQALALEQARWLQRRRGLAWGQLGCGQCLQAMNVADSDLAVLREAELHARANRSADARRALARFDALWPAERLAPFVQQRRAAVAARLD